MLKPEEIIALSKAGMSDDLILKLASIPDGNAASSEAGNGEGKDNEEKNPESAEHTEPKAEPKAEPKETNNDQNEQILNAIFQKLGVTGGAADIPPTYNVENELAKHFAFMIGGEQQK